METKTKLADRITKGHFKKDSLSVKAHGAGTVALCPVPQDGGVMSCAANTELILEAFEVTNETGLSPRELKEQRDEAVRGLEEAVFGLNCGYLIDKTNTIEKVLNSVKAILNKVKP